jgi:hypothetical protein
MKFPSSRPNGERSLVGRWQLSILPTRWLEQLTRRVYAPTLAREIERLFAFDP